MLSINELIEKLEDVKKHSNLGGETIVFFCIQDVPYIEVKDVKIDNDEDGACCLLIPSHEPF